MAALRVPKAKLDAALRAMRAIGIPKETVKPVLKRLLILYDHNWEYIEADNFQVLADAVLDVQESKEERKRKNEELGTVEQEHLDKRLKIQEESHASLKLESEMLDNERRKSGHAPLHLKQQKAGPKSPHTDSMGKMIEDASLQLPSAGLRISEPKIEPDNTEDTGIGDNCTALQLQAQESPTFGAPLAIMYPPIIDSSSNKEFQHLSGGKDSSKSKGSSSYRNKSETFVAQHSNRQKGRESFVVPETKSADSCRSPAILSLEDSSTNFEVASSTSGEVKLSFMCSSSLANRSDFRMPNIETICKEMEGRCLRSYKILEPNFSFMNLLKDMCQCIVELGSESVEAREENIIQIVPAVDFLYKSALQQTLHGVPEVTSTTLPGMSASQLKNHMKPDGVFSDSVVGGGSGNCSSSLQIIQQQQLPIGAVGPPHDVNDITKGEERVRVPIVSGIGNQKYPPSFHYIPRNITFQDAYINLSLARIGDENCCSDCFGNCLAKAFPCACATETGGEFAYTRDGLVNEGFLDACVSMLQEPHNHPHFYCKVCPIERAKNEVSPDPCKGHLIKKFIKECWSKCGCGKQCGNRVVQRGITCDLQVFLTPEGKGWGLRTVEKLARGAFVCEYVGEILTNTELYDRTIRSTGRAKHTYPVLLDADWGTEGVLKDEEALCLDATFYGNVARFINHRCFDANVIGIPVEVEMPDHHYYHLAFFTARQIEPFEELTWDYGIDFDDVDHPIKAFKCRCRSQFCRDRRISRSKSNALVSR